MGAYDHLIPEANPYEALVPKKEERNPLKEARNASIVHGTAEAGLNMLSGTIAKPLSDIAGLVSIPLHAAGIINKTPADVKSDVQSGLTYEPESTSGKVIAGYNPVALLSKAIGYVGEKSGNAVKGNESADSLRGMAGNAIEEAINQSPQFAGMRISRNAAASNQETLRAGALERSRNAVRDGTMAAARDLGMVMPPSAAGETGFITRRLENMGGKAALKQEASLRNQEATTQAARADLGLPAGTAITEGVLDNYRSQVSQPYRDVAQLPPLPPVRTQGMRGSFGNRYPLLQNQPAPAQVVADLSQVRFDANQAWREWRRTGERSVLAEAQNLSRRAEQMETYLENAATAAGRPDLVNQLRQARTMIAKSYDVQNALNLGDANVSAGHLGRALDRGAPLTGNLKTVAQFAEGPGRQFTQEGASVGVPGMSATEPYAMGAGGTMGHAMAGNVGAAIGGGLPLLRGPVRSLLLSDLYQNRVMRPTYGNLGMLDRALENANVASIVASQNAHKKD